jgi:hypothetical protein
MLVAIALIKHEHLEFWPRILEEEFQVDNRLGVIFRRLFRGLIIANFLVVGFIISTFYALWFHNIFGDSAPYIIQLCSLASWAFGAIGLLMLGGNPRVVVDPGKKVPEWIQERLYMPQEGDAAGAGRTLKVDGSGNMVLKFGYLSGSTFTECEDTCVVPGHIVESICSWDLCLRRTWAWYTGIIWFTLYLGISIALQIAGSKVATVPSEIMAVAILIVTSVVRGAGVSSSEERMIPRWKVREGTCYGASLLGQMMSRI